MIRDWYDEGLAQGASVMLVACDTWDWEDYPVYCDSEEDARRSASEISQSADKLMESYALCSEVALREAQLAQYRCHCYSRREAEALLLAAEWSQS